jgi:hypothetical protein
MSIDMNDEINDNNSSNQSTEQKKNQNYLTMSEEKLSNGYKYTTFSNNNTSSKRRKLILHFDNRNTLQVNLF